MWIQADFFLDIERFGRVAIRKIFEGCYCSENDISHIRKKLYDHFSDIEISSIRKIDEKGKSGFKIIERYRPNEDPSYLYAVRCRSGEFDSISCIHADFSFCAKKVFEEILGSIFSYDSYDIETWKDGERIDSIKII